MAASRGRLAFEGVWKQFRKGERADSLRDLFAGLLGPRQHVEELHFWALQDVSFEARPGKVLGVIGPNGAGKSTILKLGTGILAPTRGEVRVEGRVGALIEIAAGFHPDLTGRENVHLQGAVMGMRREQVRQRFDEIVDFAGLGDFIDTPVKRYSSGMSARLGFAIAAHLDPDVLLVDEVLAVGDLAFQQKASARLVDVVRKEIPVVIVSHQLDRVLSLCDEAVLLVDGSIVRQGDPLEVVSAYVQGEGQRDGAPDVGWVEVDESSLTSRGAIAPGSKLGFVVRGEARCENLEMGVWIRSVPDGTALYAAYTGSWDIPVEAGRPIRVSMELDANLGTGVYGIQPYLLDARQRDPLVRGPMTLFRVERTHRAFGQVELAARMTDLRS